MNTCIRSDSFAVLHPRVDQLSGDHAVHKDAGNNERSEEIAFAAFVDTEVWLEHFRRMNLFVTKLCFAKNLWLELELHERFHVAPLDEDLRALGVDSHAQLVFLSEEEGVFLARKLE